MPRMRPLIAGILVAALTLAFTSLGADDEDSAVKPSNKWRLEFSGGADSDGVIELSITPEGADPILAGVNIDDNTSENRVAKAVVKALKAHLPEDDFHVERDDGEDVLIKKKHHKTPNFGVEVVYNSVEGVRIKVERK